MRDDRSPLTRHGIVAGSPPNISTGWRSLSLCWRNRLGFMEKFKISRAESGFPIFQHVLELENDKRKAEQRLASIPQANELREEMADFILRHKEFPDALQRSMAERLYLEEVAQRQRVRAVHAGPDREGFSQSNQHAAHLSRPLGELLDGSANLPLIYMATVEILRNRWSASWSTPNAAS